MHAFYDTRGNAVNPTFGTTVIGGTPGHFGTTAWNTEHSAILCPLGDRKGSGQVADALELIAMSKLTVKTYHCLKDKGGILVFDGVSTSALPDCAVELHSKYASVYKAASGVFGALSMIPLAFLLFALEVLGCRWMTMFLLGSPFRR